MDHPSLKWGTGAGSKVARRGKPIRKEKKMIRNLKALGLALVAVFAMSAVAASAASAQNGIFTSDGPATLIGTQTGAAVENSLTAFGKKLMCKNATYTGHKVNVTPHEAIPNGATEITLTPHYGVCELETFPATVDMNGCDYDLKLTETTPTVADSYFVDAKVTCPVGKHIVVTLFTSAAGHTANNPFCHITITENPAGYTGLKAVDTTNKTIDLTGTIEGIEADKGIISGTTPDVGILCPTETTKTGILHIDVSAVDKNGTQIGLSHL
jgi:hypothetical protein